MENNTKGKDCNQVFFNAGHIFMLTLLFEKIMIDLLIFNSHRKILLTFNKTAKSVTLLKYRKIYWEKNFGDIFNEFTEMFKPQGIWLNKLETVLFLRNGIGHSKPSVYKEYIYIKPSQNKLKSYLENNSERKNDKRLKRNFFKINFYDYDNYNKFYNYIIELDEKYFKYIAEDIGLIYNRIR